MIILPQMTLHSSLTEYNSRNSDSAMTFVDTVILVGDIYCNFRDNGVSQVPTIGEITFKSHYRRTDGWKPYSLYALTLAAREHNDTTEASPSSL